MEFKFKPIPSEFEINDKIKQEKNMSVDHTVMYEIDGTFTLELLGDINLDNLDDLVSTLNN